MLNNLVKMQVIFVGLIPYQNIKRFCKLANFANCAFTAYIFDLQNCCCKINIFLACMSLKLVLETCAQKCFALCDDIKFQKFASGQSGAHALFRVNKQVRSIFLVTLFKLVF